MFYPNISTNLMGKWFLMTKMSQVFQKCFLVHIFLEGSMAPKIIRNSTPTYWGLFFAIFFSIGIFMLLFASSSMVCIHMFFQWNYTNSFKIRHYIFPQACLLVKSYRKHWIIIIDHIVHQLWDIHIHFWPNVMYIIKGPTQQKNSMRFSTIIYSHNFFMIKCNVSSFFDYKVGNVSNLLDLSSIFLTNAISFSFMNISKVPSTCFQNLLIDQSLESKNIFIYLFLAFVIIYFNKPKTCK